MKKAYRIEDVAKAAGVSMKTVSRVLNNEPNVRPAMREKVLEAVREMNYSPHPSARGLAGKRSYLLGLMYASVTPAYLVRVQTGVLDACAAAHYGMVLQPVDDLSRLGEIQKFLTASHIDGVILTPPLSDHTGLREQLDHHGIPYVCISPYHAGNAVAVGIDEKQAAYDLTAHLIEKGHRRIGFVEGPEDHGASRWRRDGFVSALAQAGITAAPALFTPGDFRFETGVKAGNYFMGLPQRPTAVFASNDDMAAGVIYAAHAAGLSVPEDLAVAGFDNTPLAQQIWPQLTTVHQPMFDLGKRAAENLIALLRGPDPQKTEEATPVLQLPHTLCLRASTAAGEEG